MNAITKNLRGLWRERNLTQDALAEQLHVTRQTISSWETGKTQPDIETLTELAQALGTDVNGLIYGVRPVEVPYPNRRRERIAFAAVCAVILVVWVVLELTLVPQLKTLQARTYQVLPGLIYRATARPMAGLALAGLGLGTLSIWKDIRIKWRGIRLAFCVAGIVLLVLIWGGIVWGVSGGTSPIRALYTLLGKLLRYDLWVFIVIGGCLYLGFDR